MTTTQTKPEIFTIFSNKIQGRLDPYFYRPEFRELEEKLENSKMEIKELGEIAKIKGGKRIPLGKTFSDKKTDYPYLRVTDFNQNSVNLNNLKYISKEVFDKIKNYTISTKDIYISNAGTIGLVGIIPEQLNNKSLTENAGKITDISTDKIEQKFLMYILDSKISKKQIDRELLVVGVPKLSLARISNLKIPIPPKEIQKQIIDLMDNAYNLKKQNEEKTKKLIDGIDDFVLGKLGIKMPEIEEKMCFVVYSDELEKNRIDAEFHQEKYKLIEKALKSGKYKLQKLKSFAKILKKLEDLNNYKEGINYIDLSSVDKDFGSIEKTKKLDFEEIPSRARQKIGNGDLLISGLSGSLKSIAIIDNIDDKNFIASTGFYVIKKLKEYNNFYLFSLFRTNFLQIILDRLTSGAIMSAIPKDDFYNLKIPLPPLEIQEEIAREVKSRLEKAKKLKKSASENLRKAKEEVEKILLS